VAFPTIRVTRASTARSVLGHFFDVNPGKRRSGRPSRFRDHVRFSFGPEAAPDDVTGAIAAPDRTIEERLKFGENAVMGSPMREGGTAGAPEPEH